MENNKKRALGMGLEQLFNNERLDIEQLERKIVDTANKDEIKEISLNEIRSNPHQPRKYFNEEALKELAESIKINGVIQPIILKKSIKGYELIAGERRCRASKLAGKETIPAIIRDFTDEEMMELAILENIQREDLSAIEEAEGYFKMIKATGYTQDEIARRFGKTRSHITNFLGLLRLPVNVQEKISDKSISFSHARLLSKLSDEEEIKNLAKKIVDEHISVHELENIINNDETPKLNKIVRKSSGIRPYGIYENALRDKTGVKAKISDKKIIIPFTTRADLENILTIINVEIED